MSGEEIAVAIVWIVWFVHFIGVVITGELDR